MEIVSPNTVIPQGCLAHDLIEKVTIDCLFISFGFSAHQILRGPGLLIRLPALLILLYVWNIVYTNRICVFPTQEVKQIKRKQFESYELNIMVKPKEERCLWILRTISWVGAD